MKPRIINERTVLCRDCNKYTANKPVECGVQYMGTCTRLNVPVNDTYFCRNGESKYDEI